MVVNFKSMATIANKFSSTSDVNDVFLLSKMDINNERKNKVNISNLKTAQILTMIS
jgi:hypothetical protein